MPAYTIFLGAAGSGKGTQAQRLKEDLGLNHLSTGDVLRDAISKKTVQGIEAKSYVDRGDLVPDTLILDMVRNHLEMSDALQRGFILDGFPRNKVQASALDEMLSALNILISDVVLFDIPLELTMHRILGRRICKECKKVFHIDFLEDAQNCGACNYTDTLIQRVDDTEEKIKHRYDVYMEQTAPLIEYYKDKLIRIDAKKDPDIIYEDLLGLCFSKVEKPS